MKNSKEIAFPEGVVEKILEFDSGIEPIFGVVIPVYNAELTIGRVLEGAWLAMDLPSHFVVIIDNSPDSSLEHVLNFFHSKHDSKLHSYTVLESHEGLHETRCDNVGFRFLKTTEFFLELQADIVIRDLKLGSKLKSIFDKNMDIFSISGRGGHQQLRNYNPRLVSKTSYYVFKDIVLRNLKSAKRIDTFNDIRPIDNDDEFLENGKVGFLDGSFNGRCDWKNDTLLYVTETVMRGPLAFRASTMRELDFMNYISHPLASDDHELNLRAWLDFEMKSAFLPMKLESNLEWGSDRRKKPFKMEVANLIRYLLSIKNKRKSRLYKFSYPSGILFKYEIRKF